MPDSEAISAAGQPDDPPNAVTTPATAVVEPIEKKVIRRAGGRHLVFRINREPRWFLPRPCALVSNIEGAILMFYGVGQIWLTHRKLKRINGWLVRVPRIASQPIQRIVDELQPEISTFIDEVRELELTGTILLERRVIEFHWTVPGKNRSGQESRLECRSRIDDCFTRLATSFARLQLVGEEGVQDTAAGQIQLQVSDPA